MPDKVRNIELDKGEVYAMVVTYIFTQICIVQDANSTIAQRATALDNAYSAALDGYDAIYSIDRNDLMNNKYKSYLE